jgi:hypothetical protein
VLNEGRSHENAWKGGGIASRILSLGIIWRWVVSFTLRQLKFRPWFIILLKPQSRNKRCYWAYGDFRAFNPINCRGKFSIYFSNAKQSVN